VDWVNEPEYQKNIEYLKDFLRGKKKMIMRSLKKEMADFSRKKEYEKAAESRNKLAGLAHLNQVAVGLRDDFFSSNNTFFPRIECYDISNIAGLYAVGAMIVFTNGKKDGDQYRHFKIRNQNIQLSFQPEARELESRNEETGSQIQACLPAGRSGMTDRGGNDLLMMKEMLERRFKNDWPLPNLMVIDGGETHLNVAREVVKKFNLNIPIVSIAKGAKRKKNEFHFSDESIAKFIMKNIDSQRTIVLVRDEAHRFAISYYRSLHKKGLFE
jgi:excinuclease ABC subunit C